MKYHTFLAIAIYQIFFVNLNDILRINSKNDAL